MNENTKIINKARFRISACMIVCVALLISSCGLAEKKAPWENALIDCKCTEEQWKKVERESKWCDENTDFFGSYCLKTAIWRNCTRVQEVER